MLDVSQATKMLTSLGVSSTLASKATERTAQNHANADPLTFLKELQATLKELSAEAPPAKTAAPAPPAYQPTTCLHCNAAPGTPAANTTAQPPAAAKAPFSNLDEFRQWERGLGDTFAADYEPPDYVRVMALPLSGGDDSVVGRYMFFKQHPEYAADYESIRSGQLSKFPTDGSTLVKSDLSKMSAETAAYYRKNPAELMAAEGFNMDPTLAKMRMDGKLEIPANTNASEWLMSHAWTPDGIVAQNNRLAYAQSDYIGLDGKGLDNYRLGRYDTAGNLVHRDGSVFDPTTGEAKA